MARVRGGKKKTNVLRLKSSLAKLLSFHQKQETDGRAQLQKVLRLLWKKQPRRVPQAGASAQRCRSARRCCSVPADGWSGSPCCSWRCCFSEEPAWRSSSSQWRTLASSQDLLAVVEEEKCIITFLSLTFPKCAATPVLVSLPFCPLQGHLSALSPRAFLHFRLDSCVMKKWRLRGSQTNLWDALGWCFLCCAWERKEKRIQQPSRVPGICPAPHAEPGWCAVTAQVLPLKISRCKLFIRQLQSLTPLYRKGEGT